MPTNVTAEYKKAEQAFRQARDLDERLACLKEMLRTIPKHKGTEHLQAGLKTRIKQLTDELTGPKKGGSHAAALYAVRSEGAAQVCLIGPPNAGKSSLHARLTGSHTEVRPYPYTTKLPVPGMLPFEDVHFQLVDLPPISTEYMEPWFGNAIERADAALLVVDLSDPGCVDQVIAIRARLAEKKIMLSEHWPGLATQRELAAIPLSVAQKDHEEENSDPFLIHLPTLLMANKSDLDPDPDEVKVLEELLEVHFPAVATSAETGQGIELLGAMLFRGLEIVRVYTKAPGRPADRDRPFTVRRGATVLDVARLVHKDIARTLKFARLWGSGQFNGQHVGPDHQVADRDVVELHAQQGGIP
jgi:ribosome-interacting GTPase 1